MSNTYRIVIASLVTVLIVSSVIVGSLYYSASHLNSGMSVKNEVYQDAEDTLTEFLGMDDDKVPLESVPKAKTGEKSILEDSARLTQRVTIISDAGVLPISGSVTKAQDAFYPGTYEVKFSNRAILTGTAAIRVSLNVKKGEQVYILTGNREVGYTEYDVVIAKANNVVMFDTNVIQDYTISTTDIASAQEAMASVMTN